MALKLHIGCGKRDWHDWYNIDGANLPHIDWPDVTKLPFSDGTVDLIYACHLIAYFDREEIVPILREWRRVLKSGGVLRLATPDMYTLGRLITDPRYNIELNKILGPAYGKMKMNDGFIYHKTGYDWSSIKKILFDTGFIGCVCYDHKKTDHPNTGNRNDQYDDHSASYIDGVLISLNVEATK